jgi:hypothetical protein
VVAAEGYYRPIDATRRLSRLLDFFGGMTLAEINGQRCREYAKQSSTDTIARRATWRIYGRPSTIIGAKVCMIALSRFGCPLVVSAARDGWIEMRQRDYCGRVGGEENASTAPSSFWSLSIPEEGRPVSRSIVRSRGGPVLG